MDDFKDALREEIGLAPEDPDEPDYDLADESEPDRREIERRIEERLFPETDEEADDSVQGAVRERELDESIEQHNDTVGRYGKDVEEAGQFINAQWQQLNAQRASINWQALQQQNPQQAQAMWNQFQVAEQTLRYRADQLRDVSEKVMNARRVVDSANALSRVMKLIPEWKKDSVRHREIGQLTDWLIQQGHSREAIEAETNPNTIHVAYKAWKADQKETAERGKRLKAKMYGESNSSSTRVDRLRSKLKRTGRKEDVEALLIAKGMV